MTGTGYWFTNLTYILLLHYLRIPFYPINRSYIHITVAQYKITSSLSAQPVRVQVQLLWCSKCPPFLFTQACSLFCHSSIASSTMLSDKLFHVSIKRCLRSVKCPTAISYTRSCIMLHIWLSTELRSGLLGGHKPGGKFSQFHVEGARSSDVHRVLAHCFAQYNDYCFPK